MVTKFAPLLFLVASAAIGLLGGFLVAYAKKIRGTRSLVAQTAIAVAAGCVFLLLAALAGELRKGFALPESVVWFGIGLIVLGFGVGPTIKAHNERRRS